MCGFYFSSTSNNAKNIYDFNDAISDLHKRCLESVYHNISRDNFGEESEETYWSKVHNNFYHTDYIFTNINFNNFSLGSTNYWIGRLGDHRPLMITM